MVHDYDAIPEKDAGRWLLTGDGETTARMLEHGGSIFRVAQDLLVYSKLGYQRADIEECYLKPVLAAIKRVNAFPDVYPLEEK